MRIWDIEGGLWDCAKFMKECLGEVSWGGKTEDEVEGVQKGPLVCKPMMVSTRLTEPSA